jgi:hypothetical protein
LVASYSKNQSFLLGLRKKDNSKGVEVMTKNKPFNEAIKQSCKGKSFQTTAISWAFLNKIWKNQLAYKMW